MNDYERKFDAAMAELEKSSIWRSNYAPPALRVQRSLGFQARPPHYASLLRTSIGYGFWFAAAWGIIMWFAQWQQQDMPVFAALTSSAIAGVLFGGTMSAYYAWSQRKHGLSRWEEL